MCAGWGPSGGLRRPDSAFLSQAQRGRRPPPKKRRARLNPAWRRGLPTRFGPEPAAVRAPRQLAKLRSALLRLVEHPWPRLRRAHPTRAAGRVAWPLGPVHRAQQARPRHGGPALRQPRARLPETSCLRQLTGIGRCSHGQARRQVRVPAVALRPRASNSAMRWHSRAPSSWVGARPGKARSRLPPSLAGSSQFPRTPLPSVIGPRGTQERARRIRATLWMGW